MKGLVKYAKGSGNMEIRDIPEPNPGPGQVKIEVHAAGICGSDLHIFHDVIDGLPINPPVVTGHEFAGVVAAVGENVTEWKVNDRVTSETPVTICGDCLNCRTGFYNICSNRRTLGYWYNGAFTRYTVVPQHRVHRLPDNIDFLAGALCEPLACVTHATMELTRIEAGDVVLVTGPGTIGLLAMQLAKAQGATVLVGGTGIDKERLEMAKRLGADRTVDVTREDIFAVVHELTGGRGVDVVFEHVGEATWDQSVYSLASGGRLVTCGATTGRDSKINIGYLFARQLSILGSFMGYKSELFSVLELFKRGLLKPVIDTVLPLERAADAHRRLENREQFGKVVLKV